MCVAPVLIPVMVGACRPGSRGSALPPDPTPGDAAAPAGEGDAREAPGDVLVATIPRLDGGVLQLEALRGAPLVLVLGATADPAFDDVRGSIESLVGRHAGLRVVVVAMDPTEDVVPRTWPGGPQSVVLGWDPQGALAARLQVRTLPTIFVLDRDGRLALVRGGASATALAEIEAVTDALATDAAGSGTGRSDARTPDARTPE